MRLFTALALNNEQKRYLFEWKERHFSRLDKAIAPENYHITLAFFGDVQINNLELLVERIDKANERNALPTFSLSMDQIAYWPKTGIVWVGPKQWPKALTKLATAHASAGSSLGARKTKHRYQPHVSLARGVKEFSGEMHQPSFQLNIERIGLFESVQGNAGRIQYHLVHEWCLNPFGIHPNL